jgi:cytochrome c553
MSLCMPVSGLIHVSAVGLSLLFLMGSVHAGGGNAIAGKAKAGACAGCHGSDGNGGADTTWPKLAGQDAAYLVKQMKDFKSGARKDPIMSGLAAPLSLQDIKDIAVFYASQQIKPGAAGSKKHAERGEKIYRGGNAKMGVSACMSCHGPSGHGIPPRFPRVSGQNAGYTQKQMLAFKSGRRSNDGDVMTRIAFRMSEIEIEAVSEYMAGLH